MYLPVTLLGLTTTVALASTLGHVGLLDLAGLCLDVMPTPGATSAETAPGTTQPRLAVAVSVAEQAQQIVAGGNLFLAVLVAAAAGFVSFASPCVLPLVPGYLSYMSGVSGRDVEEGSRRVGRVVLGAALFVVGFSLVFVALGATLGALTDWLRFNRGTVIRVAGILVIAMGLFLAGVIKPAFLYRERRLQANRVPAGLAGALPLGMVFGLGWTPCIGPTLGAVLGLAAGVGGAARGAVLLFAYSLGLGLPFLVAALGFRSAVGRFPSLRARFRLFELAGGGMLVVIGLLLVTGLWADFLARLQAWAGAVSLPLYQKVAPR